jgi:thiol-disulfide isomerase/thioredoxin
MNPHVSERRPRWLRIGLEVLVVILVFAGITAWRARDLLPADQRRIAPAFALADLHGRHWTTESLQGRPAVIYFFAPWCGVCAASSPQLRWFDRLAGDSVQLVLIGLDWQRREELDEYAADHALRVPVLSGNPSVASDYRIQGYPTYYVIDSEGRIAARDVGFTTVAGLWLRTRGL